MKIEIKSEIPQSKKKLIIEEGIGFVIVDEQGNEKWCNNEFEARDEGIDRICIATKQNLRKIIKFLIKVIKDENIEEETTDSEEIVVGYFKKGK